MTYHSRGRSLTEVITAVVFVGFLVGFVGVLCIGNYFRAKRAMERQRQRRMARENIDFGVGASNAAANAAAGAGGAGAGVETRYAMLGGIGDIIAGFGGEGGSSTPSSSPRSAATSGAGSDEHLHLLQHQGHQGQHGHRQTAGGGNGNNNIRGTRPPELPRRRMMFGEQQENQRNFGSGSSGDLLMKEQHSNPTRNIMDV